MKNKLTTELMLYSSFLQLRGDIMRLIQKYLHVNVMHFNVFACNSSEAMLKVNIIIKN